MISPDHTSAPDQPIAPDRTRTHELGIVERLEALPPGWQCVPAVPIGERGADLHHLVIGPAGVFAITIKHLPDDAEVRVRGELFDVNGRTQHFVRHSRFDAARIATLLGSVTGSPVEVEAVIAVTGAERDFSVRQQPADVTVVNRRTITAYLHSRPNRLDASAVSRIHQAARRTVTCPSPVAC